MLEDFKGITLANFTREWVACLSHYSSLVIISRSLEQPPYAGSFTLIFDGASKSNLGPTGYGCVIRDRDENVIHTIVGPLGDCDSIKA